LRVLGEVSGWGACVVGLCLCREDRKTDTLLILH
jgi:hypothetical protein